MHKQLRKLQFQASLALLLTAAIGIGQSLPATAHPYQEITAEEYAKYQAQQRAMIQRDPKNPEPYLYLGSSLSSEAAEGYWCETHAIAVYREAIAAIPGNARLHLRLGSALLSDPVNCDVENPAVRQAEKEEGLLHIRKAIAIAAETASIEDLYDVADALKLRNHESERFKPAPR
jgi:hypothetical protein